MKNQVLWPGLLLFWGKLVANLKSCHQFVLHSWVIDELMIDFKGKLSGFAVHQQDNLFSVIVKTAAGTKSLHGIAGFFLSGHMRSFPALLISWMESV